MAVMEATSPQPMTFMLQHSATGVKTQPGRQREKRSCVQAAGSPVVGGHDGAGYREDAGAEVVEGPQRAHRPDLARRLDEGPQRRRLQALRVHRCRPTGQHVSGKEG